MHCVWMWKLNSISENEHGKRIVSCGISACTCMFFWKFYFCPSSNTELELALISFYDRNRINLVGSEMIAVLRPSRVERQYYLSRLKISFRDHINPNCFLFLIWRSCIWKRSSNFWCVSVTVVPVFRRLHSLYAGTLEIWQCKLTNHVCVWMFEKLYMIVSPLLKSQKNFCTSSKSKVICYSFEVESMISQAPQFFSYPNCN